jgi:hypothetical protein
MAFLHAENPKAFKEIVLNFLRFEPAVFTLNLFASRVKKNQETRIIYTPKVFLKILAIKESNKNGE